MSKCGRALLLILMLLIPLRVAWSGAALVQVQQAKARKAQAEAQARYEAEQQYAAMQQQAMAQQYAQAQQVRAYQQAKQMQEMQMMAQIKAYIEQQQVQQIEQALVMKYTQEAIAAQMAAAKVQSMEALKAEMIQAAIQASVQRAMQERALAERDAEAAKMYIAARNEAMAAYSGVLASQAANAYAQKRQVEEVVGQAIGQKAMQEAAIINGMQQRAKEPEVEDIVSMPELWKALDETSKAWPLIIDEHVKVLTVTEYIERFRREGVNIRQQPLDYVHMLDDMSLQNKDMLARPFKEVVQMLAIMNYDFENGMDKDQLVLKAFGKDFYEMNRKRLGK